MASTITTFSLLDRDAAGDMFESAIGRLPSGLRETFRSDVDWDDPGGSAMWLHGWKSSVDTDYVETIEEAALVLLAYHNHLICTRYHRRPAV